MLSTGGTRKALEAAGVPVLDVAEYTGFPEMMDGRVKTLHPRVHMAILSRAGNAEDTALLKKEALDPFDLIVVNLYPFEAATTKKKLRKPKPATGPKTAASHKPRRNTRTPAPTQS